MTQRLVAAASVVILATGGATSVTLTAATPVPQQADSTTVIYGSVQGHIDFEDFFGETATGPDLWVRLEPFEGTTPNEDGPTLLGETDDAGDFVIPHVPVGDYKALFSSPEETLAPVWLGNSPYRYGSQTLTVRAGDVTDVSARLPYGSSIAGHITYSSEIPPDEHYAWAEAYLFDPVLGEFERFPNTPRSRYADWGGDYRIRGLNPGLYLLRATSRSFQFFDPEYWRANADWIGAEFVTVGGGRAELTGYDLEVGPRTLTVTRLGGANRFETAAAISGYLFPPGSGRTPDTVWIANGREFPDALSAGPAAAMQGAPILLVDRTIIPPATRSELMRLQPDRIVVVGGTGVVAPGVFDELGTIADSVVRLGGANRYETSRLVVREAFLTDGGGEAAPGAFTAVLADGGNYPDALPAGPAAANFTGPVILVPGSAHSIDGATAELLDELDTGRIYLAGGSASIGTSLENSLRASGRFEIVARLGGNDRYDTSEVINYRSFQLYDRVFLAIGTGFADAVAGAPAAAMMGAPIALNPGDCLSPHVGKELTNLKEVVLLGGAAVLDSRVEQLTPC